MKKLTPFLLLSAAVLLTSVHASEPLTKEDRNKVIARRVFEENFNQGRFQVADEIYAPDFKNHGLHGSAGLREDQSAVHAEKHAFPDLRMSVDLLVAEGDLVTAVWTFRGTHTAGGYGGLPPTGTRIEMRGITVWRIVDGRIRDEWSSFDEMGAYSQVIAHLKWPLLGILVVLLAAVVVAERILGRVFSRIWVRFQGRSPGN
ncbi:MAG: ester cyclase [Opitutales bacterium]